MCIFFEIRWLFLHPTKTTAFLRTSGFLLATHQTTFRALKTLFFSGLLRHHFYWDSPLCGPLLHSQGRLNFWLPRIFSFFSIYSSTPKTYLMCDTTIICHHDPLWLNSNSLTGFMLYPGSSVALMLLLDFFIFLCQRLEQVLWHNGWSYRFGCWHPIRVLVCILAVPLLI